MSASAMAADNVFVTVNGKAVPHSLADTFVDIYIARQLVLGADDTPELRNTPRDTMREGVIRHELLMQEAQKLGLEKRRDVTMVVAQAINAFKEKVVKDKKGKSLLDETELGWKLFGHSESSAMEMMFSAFLAREAKNGGAAKEAALVDTISQLTIIEAFVEDYSERHPASDVQLELQYDVYKAQRPF